MNKPSLKKQTSIWRVHIKLDVYNLTCFFRFPVNHSWCLCSKINIKKKNPLSVFINGRSFLLINTTPQLFTRVTKYLLSPFLRHVRSAPAHRTLKTSGKRKASNSGRKGTSQAAEAEERGAIREGQGITQQPHQIQNPKEKVGEERAQLSSQGGDVLEQNQVGRSKAGKSLGGKIRLIRAEGAGWGRLGTGSNTDDRAWLWASLSTWPGGCRAMLHSSFSRISQLWRFNPLPSAHPSKKKKIPRIVFLVSSYL